MITVSILCTTYNHEKYIEDALRSFVEQVTDFEFEVIVHDDASTDGTAEIIRKYQKMYPSIIRPIYQEENQYSKGKSITIHYMIPKARGKYIAFCEGDDYFTDSHKLQKQVDYLESHDECSLCIHNAIVVNTQRTHVGAISPSPSGGLLTTKEVIRGGGGFISTNSIMTRAEYFSNLPPFFNIMAYDFVWQMYFAHFGQTYCFSEPMSAYRKGVEGSWTTRMKKDPKKLAIYYTKKSRVIRMFDNYTGHQYFAVLLPIYLDARVRKYRFSIKNCWVNKYHER